MDLWLKRRHGFRAEMTQRSGPCDRRMGTTLLLNLHTRAQCLERRNSGDEPGLRLPAAHVGTPHGFPDDGRRKGETKSTILQTAEKMAVGPKGPGMAYGIACA